MPKKNAANDLHSISDVTKIIATLVKARDKLKDDTAELEITITTNKTQIKSMDAEIKIKQVELDTLRKEKEKRDAEDKAEKEREAKLRADIEAKIREEFEIKKRVEEEMQRQKQQLLQLQQDMTETELTKKPSGKKKDPKEKEVKEPKEKEPGTEAVKRKAIPKTVKTQLWNKFFTEDNAKGKCQVCSKEIKMSDFEAGHIIASANGGSDNLDNLTPLCGQCNKSMGTQSVYEFKKTYFPEDTYDILGMALEQSNKSDMDQKELDDCKRCKTKIPSWVLKINNNMCVNCSAETSTKNSISP